MPLSVTLSVAFLALAPALALAAVSSPQTLNDGLVGYWKFDENSANTCSGGEDACDVSGHGNHGAWNGSVGGSNTSPTWDSGVDDGFEFTNTHAMEFDGTDDYVDIGDAFAIGSEITITLWAANTDTSAAFFVSKADGSSYDFGAYKSTDEKMVFFWGANNSESSSISVPTDGSWHFYAWVVQSDGTLTFYKDTTSESTSSGIVTLVDNNHDMYIGARNNNGNSEFEIESKLDDVRIYNRALSAGEIAELASGHHPSAVWDGSSDGNFFAASNWTGSTIPDPYTRIEVPWAGQVMTLTGAIQVSGLTIATGAHIDLAGTGVTMLDSGTFTNYGTVRLHGDETLTDVTNDTAHGTVLLYGTGTLTSLPFDSYHHFNLNDGLVGYWKFDETSGTRAADSSGYGNSGSLIGGPTISTTVAPLDFTNGRALSFDGSNDYVEVRDSDALDGVNALTVATWVRFDDVSGSDKQFIIKDVSGFSKRTYRMFLDNPGTVLRFQRGDGASSYSNSAEATTMPVAGIWYHVVGTIDANAIKIYVNGKLEDSDSGATIPNSDASLYFGSLADAANTEFTGLLDDVRIYNRALSPGEIAALAAGNQPSTALAEITLDAGLAVAGDLILNGGELDTSSSNYAVTVSGSWLNQGGIFTAQDGTVTLNGTDTGKEIQSGGQQFANLTIAGTNGEWTLLDRLTVSGALAITQGTLDVSTNDYTIKAGTLNQPATGTLTPRNGSVILSSSKDGTLTASSTLNELRIEDPTEQGLVGYWKFDEGTNTGAILDSSGNGNTGARHGGGGLVWTGSSLPTNIAFENAYAMEFDGSDDFVDVGDVSPAGAAMSAFAWVKPGTSFGSNQRPVLNKGYTSHTSPFYEYAIFVLDGTSPNAERLSVWVDGTNHAVSNVIDMSNWNHIGFTYDGSNIRSFVNGVQVGSTAKTGSINDYATNAYIGAYTNLTTDEWKGLIDDVRIYNRALLPSEVARLAAGRYANGASGTATQTLGSNLTTSTLVLDSGNLDTSTYNLTVSSAHTTRSGHGSLTLGSGTASFSAGLTLSGSTITGGSGTMDVNGNLNIFTGSLIAPSGTLLLAGSYSKSGGTLTSNGGTITLDGTGDDTINTGGTDAFSDVSTLRINKASGTVSLTGNAFSGSALQISSGTFSPGSFGITTSALTIDGGTFTGGSGSKDVNGLLTLSSGTLSQGTSHLNVSGDVRIANGSTFTKASDGTSRLILDGDLTFEDETGANLGILQIGTSPDTTTLSGSIVVDRLLVSVGDTLITDGFNVTIGDGGLTNSGTITASAGNGGTTRIATSSGITNHGTYAAGNSTLTLSGSFTNRGTFTANTSTVELDGTSQTLTGTTTFFNLTKTVATADTLTFAEGQTFTVSNSLTLQGADSNLLSIRSSTDGIAAALVLSTGGTQTIDHLDVQDSDATGGETLICSTESEGCIDSGNTTNWQFLTDDEEAEQSSGGGGGGGARRLQLERRRAAGGGGAGGARVAIGSGSSPFPVATDIDYSDLASGDLRSNYPVPVTSDSSDVARRVAQIKQALIEQFQEQQRWIAQLARITEERREEYELHGAGPLPDDTQRRIGRARFNAQVAQDDRGDESRRSGPAQVAQRRGVLFAVVEEQPVVFADVKVDQWYAPYVSFLIEEKIAVGYKDEAGKPKGEFGVGNPVTKEEILKMAMQGAGTDLTGLPPPRNGSAQGRWSALFVSKAEALGLSVFAADVDVTTPATRSEVIQTIMEVMGVPLLTISDVVHNPFHDLPADHIHAKAMITAKAFGIIEGDTNTDGTVKGTVRPDDHINRAEVSKIIALTKNILQ